MGVDYQHLGKETDELQTLISYGNKIEHKFNFALATNIHVDFVREIIILSIHVRMKTASNPLKEHLTDIEDTAYAVLVNENKPEYFALLRHLTNQLQSLKELI